MRILCAAAAAAIFVCGIARADEPGQPPVNGDAAVGVGIICDTPQQAELFVSLRSKGSRPDKAMNAVNATVPDKRACGVAAIAYIRDQTVRMTKLQDKLVQIVRINVVAGYNGTSWQRISDMVQYAVLEGGGVSI
jgi:hypothetical protein